MNMQSHILIDDSEQGPVPVDIAREQSHAAMNRFIEEALEFHAKTAHDPAAANSSAPHRAIKVTTGIGKSNEMRRGAARFVLVQKRHGHSCSRVAFLVPTHRLAEEASNKMDAVFGSLGVWAVIYQSREAKDLYTGEPLCAR